MTRARLFEFSLDPLDEVHAWGAEPDQSLSWFGLTQGRYRLNGGGHLLLNYSDAMVTKHAADWPDAYPGPLVDYYVVRLWEDLLSILPEALAPLPRALHDIMALPDAERDAWSDGLSATMSDDGWMDATGWIAHRIVDSGYLQHGPSLRCWSCDGQTFIGWDCTRHVKDGAAVWSATAGHHAMTIDEFRADVADFNERLISGMAERVDAIVDGWRRHNVRIDVQALTLEHAERATALDAALGRTPASFERALEALAGRCRGSQ